MTAARQSKSASPATLVSRPTKKPDAFASALVVIRAAYGEEIRRLAEAYRPRILSGEFSGRDKGGDLAYMRLEQEIAERHPWAKRGELGRAVLAVSPWVTDGRSALGELEIELEGPGLAQEVGECMCHDILAVAAERGWSKPQKGEEPAYRRGARKAVRS
jgi:hypothetical protein